MNSVDTSVERFWTHQSIQGLSDARDPIAYVIGQATAIILDAMEGGWDGPPFDTFELADMLGFTVIPHESVRDARLVPVGRSGFRIEYNPNRSPARTRFSIAHEIGHTFFPDCREHVRNRKPRQDKTGDDWQLEMLCNIAAAELLMPLGSFPDIGNEQFSIDTVLGLRDKFQVSTEAVLLRFLKRSRIPCAVFAASRHQTDPNMLRVDYIQFANGWEIPIGSGFKIPQTSRAHECQAIGYTAMGPDDWGHETAGMRLECVAIPSYPGNDNPRLAGILSPAKSKPLSAPTIENVVGDATQPRGEGNRIIAHVVNDATPRWGGGFASVVRKHWSRVQDDFTTWVSEDKTRLQLGRHHLFDLDESLSIYHMVAQKGYGPSPKPRIRYRALRDCLLELSEIAKNRSATVHMPRIGCGQARGNWDVVSELIDESLCRNGVSVTVYDLPSERSRWMRPNPQQELFSYT